MFLTIAATRTAVSVVALTMAMASVAVRITADPQFLHRLRSGDPTAIRGLIARHHGALVGLAQTIVKSREAAEDVAQETWIAVIDGIGRFDGRSALSTWIIAILLNKARTVARKESRFVALADEMGDDLDEPAVSPSRFAPDGHWVDPPASFDGVDPERICAGRELWRHVGAAIERLPPAQKAVLILRDVEGRDAAETCRLLDLTPENQRILLHRARAKLRNLVEGLVSPRAPLAKA